jgi:hypothetical protein
MYLVFMNESGITGVNANDPNQPHHVHAGLLVHENQYISMTGEFDALFRRHFGGRPGSAGLPGKLSARDIYQGQGVYRTWQPTQRAELLQDCFNILIRRETPLLVSYINKGDFEQARESENNSLYGHGDPSQLAFGRFLFALTMFMDENVMSEMNPEEIMQSTWSVADYALLMAGSDSESVSQGLSQFLSDESDTVTPSLYDDLLIARSTNSVGAQLVAMCAYVVRRWLQQPDVAHSYFDALRDGRVIQVVYPYQFD